MENNLVTIKNVRGYINQEGTAFLNLEDVARGLGFVETAKSGNEVVRWRTIRKYLLNLGIIATSCDGQGKENLPEFIPENIFYKLCMKANNDTARKFQDLVCDEILPNIRKNGGYIALNENDSDTDILARAILIAQKTIENKDKKIIALEKEKEEQKKRIEKLEPEAAYCEAMLIADGLTAPTEIAKNLGFKSAKELNKELNRVGVQYKTGKSSPWQLYSKYADKGYAKTVPTPKNTTKGLKSYSHLYWTEAGKKFIFELKKQGVIKTVAEKVAR